MYGTDKCRFCGKVEKTSVPLGTERFGVVSQRKVSFGQETFRTGKLSSGTGSRSVEGTMDVKVVFTINYYDMTAMTVLQVFPFSIEPVY